MLAIAERLIKARDRAGYTQQNLADAIGVTRSVIMNLETKNPKRVLQKLPPDIVINAICRELDINKQWLLTGEGEMCKSTQTPENEYLRRFEQVAADLSPDEWEFLFKIIEAMKEMNKERLPQKEAPRKSPFDFDGALADAQARAAAGQSKPTKTEHER